MRIELLCRRCGLKETVRSVIPTGAAKLFGLDMTGDFASAWLPAIFVPITGIVFPAVFIVLVGRVITAAE